jgi:RNA polymerase sigma-70 factor, ECF subfamily
MPAASTSYLWHEISSQKSSRRESPGAELSASVAHSVQNGSRQRRFPHKVDRDGCTEAQGRDTLWVHALIHGYAIAPSTRMNHASTSAPSVLAETMHEREAVSTLQATPSTLKELVLEHVDFVWRSLRRFGVPAAEVDDATQQVFLVADAKRSQILAGNERAFLIAVALRVASHARRAEQRRQAGRQLLASGSVAEESASPEQLAQRSEARVLLDRVLNEMPERFRTVFVLSELEELTIAEIADLLKLPPGTIASRIRRARVVFHEQATLLQEVLRRGKYEHAQ